MKTNMGRLDQVLRVGTSLGLIYLGFFKPQLINDSFSRYLIGSIGIISLIIAALRHCPLYTLSGINTCPGKKDPRRSE